MKFTIIKVSADGEQLSAEMHLDKAMLDLHRSGKVHLRAQFAPIFDLMDARLLEMNNRIMASNYLVKKLPAEAQIALSNVMDVLHGKSSGPATAAIVEQARAEAEAARQQFEAERSRANEAEDKLQAQVESGVTQGAERPKRAYRRKPNLVDGSNGGQVADIVVDAPVGAE